MQRTLVATCPICKQTEEVSLDIPDEMFKETGGLVSMLIGANCGHQYVMYLDTQLKIRGYQRVDFSKASTVASNCMAYIYDSKHSRLRSKERKQLATLLAHTFHDYPIYTYLLPDETTRIEKLSTLFEICVKYAERNGTVLWLDDFSGVLLALSSDNLPINPAKLMIAGAARLGLDFIQHQETILKTQDDIRSRIAGIRDHEYLWALGIAGENQGEIIKMLVNNFIKVFVVESELCYVEMANTKDILTYERLGFNLAGTEEITLSESQVIPIFSMTLEKDGNWQFFEQAN